MARCGKTTEVFSRCCGYHRPVANWNKGKRSEFVDRVVYSVGKAEAAKPASKDERKAV